MMYQIIIKDIKHPEIRPSDAAAPRPHPTRPIDKSRTDSGPDLPYGFLGFSPGPREFKGPPAKSNVPLKSSTIAPSLINSKKRKSLTIGHEKNEAKSIRRAPTPYLTPTSNRYELLSVRNDTNEESDMNIEPIIKQQKYLEPVPKIQKLKKNTESKCPNTEKTLIAKY
ncbi:hypothetical protein EVAR_19884_1 [Eumeta japonica]|uniref:Uncharacterized protein n=1 Tax=Eumeta variegata TaxID=151549 RepID=A0A4C1XN52_EUMVA|nr:hypothetical protein EVAR_19884_1 [Eumeta japonica]